MTSSLLRACACALLVLAAPGCLDLDLPNVAGDGGVGPDLTIRAPRPGEVIPLNAPVSVDAVSVNGVRSVSVLCGSAPGTGVYIWDVAPYSAVVDFTRCSLATTGGADAGVRGLTLTFVGVDALGHESRKSIDVQLDATAASLTTALPGRVPPKSSLTLTVGSDRPLAIAPTVRLAGREADGIVQRPNPDGGAAFYDVTFAQTPGLGIDLYGGDPFNVPFEVLSQVEQSVPLSIDARAANGNTTHVDTTVLLSRVLWDRAVPGRLAIQAASPAATARGIGVPLATVDTTTTASSDWLPGFFAAADGTYVPFDPTRTVIVGKSLPALVGRPVPQGLPPQPPPPVSGDPFPVDAGYVAVDFDAAGRTLFARPSQLQRGSDLIALAEPDAGTTTRIAASYTVQFTPQKPLTRVDDLLCVPDTSSGCQTAPSSKGLGCFSLRDGSTVTAQGTSPTLGLGAGAPGRTAGTQGPARTYLAPEDQVDGNGARCADAWMFFGLLNNAFVATPRTDPAFGGGFCRMTTVDRLFPLATGGYVVGVTIDCGAAAPVLSTAVYQIDAGGKIGGRYALGQLGPQRTLLAALVDGTIVTLRNDPPFTVFEAWGLTDELPRATARVPGLYVYTANPTRLGTNLAAGADGSLSVLLNSATLGDVVIHLGPGLKPQWIYLYPRVAFSGASTLVSTTSQGLVYYVDPTNNEIVALKRF